MRKSSCSSWLLLGVFSVAALNTGCALSPQIIDLNTESSFAITETVAGRSALVRVRDERDVTDNIGHRGGSIPEEAIMLTRPTLKEALTEKMQASLTSLGFGGISPIAPVKVELVVNQFNYQCNKGNWVKECQLDIELALSIDNNGQVFGQPFRLNETRDVALAPQVGYNTLWINESLDKLWQHIFTKPQVQDALGI